MYIEMTTFAVPTFLLTLIKVIAIAAGVWLILGAFGIFMYNRSIARAIKKQMEIDAEIDRLHK